jgi:hypothetical protein
MMFEISAERRNALIEQWAKKIVARGLATPAVFLLEAHKPISGIGANLAIALQPFLQPLLSMNFEELAGFVSRVENVELLERRIEDLEQERQTAESAAKAHQREVRRRAKRIKTIRRGRRAGS